MRRLQILGSGNAFNTGGRAHACYLLENSSGRKMLLDFGATSLRELQKRGVNLLELDFLLLTHFHGDHFGGLPFLLLELDLILRRDSFTIIGPPGVQAACETLLDAMYPDYKFRLEIEYREVKGPFTRNDFHIEAIGQVHRPESLGYRIRGPRGRSMAFSGDASFDENLFALVDGVDAAIVELSMEKQEDPPIKHVALDEVQAGREKLRAKRVIFTHIYDQLAAQVRALELGEVAEDGMIIDFP